MFIDSHQHFWRYNKKEFGWIDESKKTIRRDFFPDDLEKEMNHTGIEGTISVQARQLIEETEWLLQLAENHPFIRGVVGWLPIADRVIDELIGEFMASGKLKGLRHVIQDEPDPDFILRAEFNKGIQTLNRHGLVYDILVFEWHLPQSIQFVDRHPNQVFVIDHIAKPRIRERVISPWKEHIMSMAKRQNVYCKISGMVTEADFKQWTHDQLAPYFDIILEAFGTGRLMFGSDWPVCEVATSYKDWYLLVLNYLESLSDTEKKSIFGENAAHVYQL